MSCEIELDIVQDPSSLSKIALIDAYKNVSSYCYKQKESIEKYKQKIYKLEQEKILKDSVQQDELQAQTENFEREKKKLIVENKGLHGRLTELSSTIEKLELENEHLKCELDIRKKPQPPQQFEVNACKENEVVLSKERIERLEKTEADYLTLIDDNTNLKDELIRVTLELTQKEV